MRAVALACVGLALTFASAHGAEPAAGKKPVTFTEAQAKTDSGTVEEKPGVRIPTGKNGQRRAIHQPWIVFRNVNHVRSRQFDDDRLSLSTYFLLGRRLQIPGLLSPLSHGLDRLGQLLLGAHRKFGGRKVSF